MIASYKKPAWFLFLAAAIILSTPAAFIFAATESKQSLDEQIKAKNEEIKRLEEEAQKYKETLTDIGHQANTLQSRIKTLDTSLNRLNSNIKVTNAKIGLTTLEIEELADGITEKETSIKENRDRLAKLLSTLAASDRETPLEIMMKNETLSSFFSSINGLANLQRDVRLTLSELRDAKEELKQKKDDSEKKRRELTKLVATLSDQKNIQEYERKERASVLAETKNQEKKYQDLLAEVERKREALQQEINSLEAGLKISFDLSLLPKAGTGTLGWPLPDPIFITQYFGSTSFARSGAYNGKGHNGIDFRAAVGTPVFSAEGGVVRAAGDTDTACRGASYGRWVLIDHNNNLATLYAHLSLIKVKSGDSVKRGDLIAYSGKTGYATGPHLHLTVFAKQAVEVGQLKSRVCKTIMTLPLSPFGGYINPIDYL